MYKQNQTAGKQTRKHKTADFSVRIILDKKLLIILVCIVSSRSFSSRRNSVVEQRILQQRHVVSLKKTLASERKLVRGGWGWGARRSSAVRCRYIQYKKC